MIIINTIGHMGWNDVWRSWDPDFDIGHDCGSVQLGQGGNYLINS
jgi:hypothetical protein